MTFPYCKLVIVGSGTVAISNEDCIQEIDPVAVKSQETTTDTICRFLRSLSSLRDDVPSSFHYEQLIESYTNLQYSFLSERLRETYANCQRQTGVSTQPISKRYELPSIFPPLKVK